jgi:hypothetical protein
MLGMTAEHGVVSALRRSGYVLLGPRGECKFMECVGLLGAIVSTYDVYILRKRERSVLNSPHAMHYHTDAPCADYVAWQCVEPGRINEALLLIDMLPFVSNMTRRERLIFETTECKLPDWYKSESALLRSYEKHRLLSIVGRSAKLNYTPWLKFQSASTSELQRALHLLRSYVKFAAKTPVEVRLRRSECAVIDNGRFLHARTRLHSTSKRRHRRFWIAKLAPNVLDGLAVP